MTSQENGNVNNSVLFVYLLILCLYKCSVLQSLFQWFFQGSAPMRQKASLPCSAGPKLSALSSLQLDNPGRSQSSVSEISCAVCWLDPGLHPTHICIFYILCVLTDLANSAVTLCFLRALYGSWIHLQVGAVFSEVL